MARGLQVADVVGGFRLERQLPSGGQASFWDVTRSDVDFPVVMKIPLLRRGEDPLAIVAFEVEQMILPRLTGPHVPRFVAAGDFDGPYIVMERIAGATLERRVADLPLPYAEVAALGAGLAAALHDIHRQHVIHLDLKPSNAMRRTSGEIALIDFGLARHMQLPDLPAEEFDGPFGTGPYVSPEQIHNVRDDPRSDLFALGVMLYLFSTGEFPFGDPMTYREWRRRLYWDPAPPRRWRADYPPWLQEIVLHCLERDPAQRYQKAAHVGFDLQNPDQVRLTERATRTAGTGLLGAAVRWLRRHTIAEGMRPAPAADPELEAPIVMAALDFEGESAKLAEALRATTRRVLETAPGARLVCVNVFRLARLRLDSYEDQEGRNIHLRRLAELQHWARPLASRAVRTTFHVIEAADAASALVEFAQRNHADHIVIGARASSRMRRYLGSVSAQVVAEAPCTVTVVRAR